MDLATRTGLDKIVRDTRQALALYYNSVAIQDYILRWSRFEDADKLQERRDRTLLIYRNYPREIIHKYLEGLYRRQDSIQRTSPDKDFQAFLDGYYDRWFRRELAVVALLLPEVYVQLVPVGAGAFRPAVVFPQYVTNFEMSPSLDLISVDMKLKEREYMRITNSDVMYYTGANDKDGNIVWWPKNDGEPYEHNFGFCPVVRIAIEENVEIATLEGTPIGHSFMYPIIQETTADLQFRSAMMEAAHDHLSYQLIMSEKTADETMKTGMGSDMPIIEGDGEHGSTRYLQKPAFEMETLRKIVNEDMPREIFEIARLQSRTASSSAQTGAARAYDLYPENGVLTNIASYFWDADDRIVQMLAKAMEVTAEVRYPTVFDTRNSSDTLRDAQTFVAVAKDLPSGQLAIRELTKQVERALMPGVSSEKLAAFDREIDRAPIPFLKGQALESKKIDIETQQLSQPQLPASGQGSGEQAPRNTPPQAPAQLGSGNDNPPPDRPGGGPDAVRDGGTDGVPGEADREVANPMAIALVANCEAGAPGSPSEEEQEYEQLLEGLEEAGYEVQFINLANSLDALASLDPDVMIWNAIEGFHDKAQFEMHAAAWLELAHYRFTGSGAKTLGILQDKALTKTVLAGIGVPVKRAVLLKRGGDVPDMSYLAWPRMVKPAAEDASEGITAENVTNNPEEMQRVIARLFTITDSILVEEYVDGRELLVAVLGNGKERIVLPPMEIEFLGDAKVVTQDAKQKADSKDFDEVVSKDAILTPAERQVIENVVLLATRALEIQDYARVDLRLTPDGVPVIIEINPNPDLSPDHGFGGSAQLAGMKFPELLDRVVKIAQKRYEPRGAQ